MATLGGGPPMLSLLTGVAQGISANRETQRKERDQAIINRLREQQIETADANIETAKKREDTRRIQAEADAADMAERQRVEAEQAAAKSALMEQFVTAREQEIMTEGLTDDPNAARLKAMLEAQEQDFDQFMQPEEVDEGPSISEQRFLNQTALEDDVRAILRDDTLRHAVGASTTLEDALKAAEGHDPMAVTEAWTKLGGGDMEPTKEKGFKLDDETMEAIGHQASGEADKMILQATLVGANDENAPAAALNSFNKKMEQIRQAQAQGAHISNLEMATLESIYNELVRRTTGGN